VAHLVDAERQAPRLEQDVGDELLDATDRGGALH
jgi:hypothetical protein